MTDDATSRSHLVGTPSRSHLVLRDVTNERTNERRSRVTDRASLTDTCARVQEIEMSTKKLTPTTTPEPSRGHDAAEVRGHDEKETA